MTSQKNHINRSIVFNTIFIVFMIIIACIIIVQGGTTIVVIPSFFVLMGFILLYRDIKKLKKNGSSNT